jgi:hypothetical protein
MPDELILDLDYSDESDDFGHANELIYLANA